jgi:hypothetical protein
VSSQAKLVHLTDDAWQLVQYEDFRRTLDADGNFAPLDRVAYSLTVEVVPTCHVHPALLLPAALFDLALRDVLLTLDPTLSAADGL